MYFDWSFGCDVVMWCLLLCFVIICLEWSIIVVVFVGLVMVIMIIINFGLWNRFVGIFGFVCRVVCDLF